MSAEFRQRTAGEYTQMLRRRKWLIILPILTITTAVAYTVYQLPSVYQSETLLTVKPPMISNLVVRPLSDSDITQRIQAISTEVQSRSTLEPLVTKYNLFERERNDKVPMELIIDQMRKNIEVAFKKTDRDNLASFEIKYRDNTPEAARDVTAELASKYVTAQVTDSTERARETQDFVETELAKKKQDLDVLEKQRLDIMRQNVDTLPDSAQGLIAQLEGYRKQEETLGRDIQSLQLEKGRVNESIGSINREIRLLDGAVREQTENTIRRTNRIEDTPAYATISSELSDLRAELVNLRGKFRENHPDVIAAKNKIKEKEGLIKQMEAAGKKRSTEARIASSSSTEILKKRSESEKIRLQQQIGIIDQSIAAKQRQLALNESRVASVESKINAIPNVKVLLESVDAQYQSAKAAYDDLGKTRNDATLQVNRESKAQGETISVVDPANLPKAPVAPKREVLTLFGAFFGLAFGMFLVAMVEVPRMFKVQNIADAKHYTGLPLLAAVPPLHTPAEIRWNQRSHWLKVMAAISIAIGMIPVLIIVLKVTGVFQRFVS